MLKYLCLLLAVLLAWHVNAQDIPPTSSSVISGLNVVLLGDSNTWIGGDSCDSPRGWNYWFARQMKPQTIRSYARSGATWSHTSGTSADVADYSEIVTDKNVIFNQVIRLIKAVGDGIQPAPDMIMIAAGTNDAWFPQFRLEEFSKTAEEVNRRDETELMMTAPSKLLSLAEAVRYDLLLLKARFPEATIVVMTPMQSIKISPEMLADVSGIIEQVAVGQGAQVLRQDLFCPVNSDSEMLSRKLTTDGTHTSEEGARRNAEVICGFVEKIYNAETAERVGI